MPGTQEFQATGLTCGHCAHAVTEELTALDGVREVGVEVVADGASTVTVIADRALTDAEVTAALDEAGGYRLVEA
ncbi:heavy metal transporter [Phycicoccus sp. HDW14]|uniref:heavy-metal-associated domain-containing protein n=1 Tax=Phycicoccus sp. HDW14 TaxID=2714941 RepID=UPI00140DC6B8|nr:cation transporter [Phycicoccus sp. HDW14]QIM22737.1 heavy metal transporter [Phycicoccus sp. HDW14]